MKHRKTLLFMLMIGILIGGFSQAQEQSENFPVLKGPYLDQKPPGMIPEIFISGIVSTVESQEFAGTFSPDGREFFFTRVIEAPYSQIMYIYMYL
jgi:hypothetical protein